MISPMVLYWSLVSHRWFLAHFVDDTFSPDVGVHGLRMIVSSYSSKMNNKIPSIILIARLAVNMHGGCWIFFRLPSTSSLILTLFFECYSYAFPGIMGCVLGLKYLSCLPNLLLFHLPSNILISKDFMAFLSVEFLCNFWWFPYVNGSNKENGKICLRREVV